MPCPSALWHALSGGWGGAVGSAGNGLLLPVGVGCGAAVVEADGVVPALGSAVGSGLGDDEAVAVGSGAGGGSTCSAAYTARNRSSAVRPTSRTSSSCCTFGTVTISCRSPAVTTSDSPTPRLSTRFWMMVWASFRLFGSIGPVPEVFCAVRVMVVPPCRSRPSFGDQALFTAIRVISPATRTPSTIKVRPGCPVVVVATCVKVLRVRRSAGGRRLLVGAAGRRLGLGQTVRLGGHLVVEFVVLVRD